ncbi:phosphodiester glycosidase family protein [Flavobacterium silvaticum]|uniref:Phosphodiester glycosidase domain-containing protein n=1 Tax=Flavobacterium silvaticum TaxID=1852020 RepID=A0A972FQP4_9FLAO|nr:phosphodiester glycosidase family protein [Flavobacterium silvaticum]NMH29605.1 hypothetical protein [Flavobacterium silvaticum]
MNRYKLTAILSLIALLAVSFAVFKSPDDRFISYITEAKNIQFFYKSQNGQNFGSIQNLKTSIESQKKKLLFATNGGMYKKDRSPQGLFIQDGKIVTRIDTATASGNFYLKPNGVFFISGNNEAQIQTTANFHFSNKIKFATQSGPMLVINGEIHPEFKKGSTNLNIRNGVGILPNVEVIFAISKKEVNFYDFAEYFKDLGCKNALYLDGFVSRMYVPEKNWVQTDGDFGVIIGVVE